jgi:hypothetical protein
MNLLAFAAIHSCMCRIVNGKAVSIPAKERKVRDAQTVRTREARCEMDATSSTQPQNSVDMERPSGGGGEPDPKRRRLDMPLSAPASSSAMAAGAATAAAAAASAASAAAAAAAASALAADPRRLVEDTLAAFARGDAEAVSINIGSALSRKLISKGGKKKERERSEGKKGRKDDQVEMLTDHACIATTIANRSAP